MHFLFAKLKVLFWDLIKQSIAINTDLVISSPLPNILGQNATCTRPMQIYMNAGVSLLRFKYPATLKKLYRKCNNMNYIFPNCYFRAKNIIVHIQKIKIKNFIVVVMLLNFSYIFHFSFFPFSMSFLYLLLCEEFLSLFKVPHIFLVILFSFLRTLYNT